MGRPIGGQPSLIGTPNSYITSAPRCSSLWSWEGPLKLLWNGEPPRTCPLYSSCHLSNTISKRCFPLSPQTLEGQKVKTHINLIDREIILLYIPFPNLTTHCTMVNIRRNVVRFNTNTEEMKIKKIMKYAIYAPQLYSSFIVSAPLNIFCSTCFS